jgi:tetratricopeptide (TPR) repeat protein
MTIGTLTASRASASDRRSNRFFSSTHVRVGILITLLVTIAVTATPALVQYRLMRGRNELARGNSQAALIQFREAERLQPRRAETHFWLARTNRKLANTDEFGRHLDRARRLGYSSPERLRRESHLLMADMGRIREVEEFLPDMLMSPGEDGTEICDSFARGFGLNLQYDKALTLLSAWEKDHPDDYRPRFRRGQIHASDGQDFSKAEVAFRESLKLAPDRPEVHRELGKTLLELRKLDEAEQHLRKAAQINPADVDAQFVLAKTLKEQGDPVLTTECLHRVLELDPRNDPARVLLARLTLESGDAEGAIRELTPLIDLWPEDLMARYCLADALRTTGRIEEAKAHFKAYAELEKNSQRLDELSRTIRKRPFDPELRYEMGLLRMKHLSRAEGVLWLQSVFLYASDHAGAHQALAEYYRKIGDRDLAERHRVAAERQPATSPLEFSKPQGPTP